MKTVRNTKNVKDHNKGKVRDKAIPHTNIVSVTSSLPDEHYPEVKFRDLDSGNDESDTSNFDSSLLCAIPVYKFDVKDLKSLIWWDGATSAFQPLCNLVEDTNWSFGEVEDACILSKYKIEKTLGQGMFGM